MTAAIDSTTRAWIRNAADERAAGRGFRFDRERAAWAIWWIERYCNLYEGEWAGTPLILRGSHAEELARVELEWDEGGREASLARMERYEAAVAAGVPCDWQYECIARVFGWTRFSSRWQREIRRFTRASIWVAKKNKKSPTMAAVALYLLAGDGEPGQKVFLGAKDAEQLRKNVALHVVKMVDASPELAAACKVNRNEMSVAHLASDSLLALLSSSNERTQQSKEGLNGSLLVDEVHVVDRSFIARIDRMGISRSEPLIAQFSTTGKDSDCYGKEEFDYGLEVNAGIRDDDSYFFAAYTAPQDLSDEDLAADPAKYIRLANPALGHTVDLAEALADYERSKDKTQKLQDFKVYRLCIWSRAENPWILIVDWNRCRQEFTEESLHGRACGSALDLGQTDDMSALALAFPESPEEWALASREIKEAASAAVAEAYTDRSHAEHHQAQTTAAAAGAAIAAIRNLDLPVKLLVWYWLPEAAVAKYGHLVPYGDWARDGFLRLTPGQTIDQNQILAEIKEIFARFAVKMFAYDPWFAQPIVEDLKKSIDFPADYCWPFKQSVAKYAFPSALFERLILAGRLHHNAHPITDWQAGHVRAKLDASGNMRPAKPERGNRKKVDGIVAAIMALDAATYMESIYNSCYESMGGVRSV